MSIKKLTYTGSSKIIKNLVTTVNALIDAGGGVTGSGAGYHNSVFRGKNLGSALTANHWAKIKTGEFDDLFIGDYIVSGGTNWRIGAFDYWLNTGNTSICTTHHVVIVPDTNIDTAIMNDTFRTTGGYTGSELYFNMASGATAWTPIVNAFGNDHLLTIQEAFTSAVTDDKATNFTWKNIKVFLMNECMVLGHNSWGSEPGYETGIDKTQLPLFQMRPDLICNSADYWLRDVCSSYQFARIVQAGRSSRAAANANLGIRPCFAIYQA